MSGALESFRECVPHCGSVICGCSVRSSCSSGVMRSSRLLHRWQTRCEPKSWNLCVQRQLLQHLFCVFSMTPSPSGGLLHFSPHLKIKFEYMPILKVGKREVL